MRHETPRELHPVKNETAMLEAFKNVLNAGLRREGERRDRRTSREEVDADRYVRSTDDEPPDLARRRNPAALLTVPEVAALLHVPTSWVYEHVRPGCSNPLPVVRIGKYLRFQMSDLAVYIDSLAVHMRRGKDR
jgi:predicted DNA-binding transcriptional regulator AlpA